VIDSNIEVLTCKNVFETHQPILFVAHDGESEWQFTCGGDEHEDTSVVQRVRLYELLRIDQSIVSTFSLPVGFCAERGAPEQPWSREKLEEEEDDAEALGRECIENVRTSGLQIFQIAKSESDDGYSYTVGLFATFGHPEIVVFGQKAAWQSATLNFLAAEIKSGKRFEAGTTHDGILAGFACRFIAVASPDAVRDYLPWAAWYYEFVAPRDEGAPIVQLVWADKNGRYPSDASYESYRQPLLAWR